MSTVVKREVMVRVIVVVITRDGSGEPVPVESRFQIVQSIGIICLIHNLSFIDAKTCDVDATEKTQCSLRTVSSVHQLELSLANFIYLQMRQVFSLFYK